MRIWILVQLEQRHGLGSSEERKRKILASLTCYLMMKMTIVMRIVIQKDVAGSTVEVIATRQIGGIIQKPANDKLGGKIVRMLAATCGTYLDLVNQILPLLAGDDHRHQQNQIGITTGKAQHDQGPIKEVRR